MKIHVPQKVTLAILAKGHTRQPIELKSYSNPLKTQKVL